MRNSVLFNTNHLQPDVNRGHAAPLGFAPVPIVGAPVTANIVRMPVGAIRRGNRF